MDATTVTTHIEAAIANQMGVAAAGPETERAATALLAALEPAMRHAVHELAEQAAAEVAAQLPGHRVEVVLHDGDPALRVTADDGGASSSHEDDYEARITLRLPERLKQLIEESAGASGDSINSWVVKTVSSRVNVKRRAGGTRVTGTIET